MPRHVRAPRRAEVRRFVARRRGPDPAGRAPDRPRARARAASSSSSCPRWATPPTSCSPWQAPSPTIPTRRELDVLLATGEHQSATLVSMALHALGVPAISLTGAQAGISTDGRYGRARIANVDPTRVRAELAQGKVVIVAGFQGMSQAALPRPTDEARAPHAATAAPPRRRPSVAAAPTRRPSRSRRASTPTAARSSPTSAASTPRIRASCPTPASCG